MVMKVLWLGAAEKQAKKLFPNKNAQAQLQMLVERLKHWDAPELMGDVPVKKLKGLYSAIWEMRLKGGAIGKLNVRVFFAVGKEIVILGVTKKERQRGIEYVYETMLNRLNEAIERRAFTESTASRERRRK